MPFPAGHFKIPLLLFKGGCTHFLRSPCFIFGSVERRYFLYYADPPQFPAASKVLVDFVPLPDAEVVFFDPSLHLSEALGEK